MSRIFSNFRLRNWDSAFFGGKAKKSEELQSCETTITHAKRQISPSRGKSSVARKIRSFFVYRNIIRKPSKFSSKQWGMLSQLEGNFRLPNNPSSIRSLEFVSHRPTHCFEVITRLHTYLISAGGKNGRSGWTAKFSENFQGKLICKEHGKFSEHVMR